MNSESLQQLLELEVNLSKVSLQFSEKEVDQTELLLSHLVKIQKQNQNIFSKNITITEIQIKFKEEKNHNIFVSCDKCHSCLFDNEIDAINLIAKFSANDCCLKTLENYRNRELDTLELTYWWFFLNNFFNCILSLPNYTRFILRKGIPSSLRSIVWGKILQIDKDDYYGKLYQALNMDVSSDLKIIENDFNRSIPGLQFNNNNNNNNNTEKMVSVLNAFSIYQTNIGYCQGLQFLSCPIFNQFSDEIDCFKALIQLFQVNEKLSDIYDHSMSGLELWFYQFEQIFKSEIPNLSIHFQNLNIDLKIFLSQWFISLFSITIPIIFVPRIFDVILLEGFQPTIFRISILILKENEDLLLSIDDDELIMKHFLSDMCWCVFHNNEIEFMDKLMNISISKFTIDHLKNLESKYQTNKNIQSKTIFGKFMNGLKSTTSFDSTRLRSTSVTSLISTNSSSSSSSSSSKIKRSDSSYSSQSSIISQDDDLDLLAEMMKLCINKGIEDPLLDKVRLRLEMTT